MGAPLLFQPVQTRICRVRASKIGKMGRKGQLGKPPVFQQSQPNGTPRIIPVKIVGLTKAGQTKIANRSALRWHTVSAHQSCVQLTPAIVVIEILNNPHRAQPVVLKDRFEPPLATCAQDHFRVRHCSANVLSRHPGKKTTPQCDRPRLGAERHNQRRTYHEMVQSSHHHDPF